MSYPYVISHEKLSLCITVLNINGLYLHEEILPDVLSQLARSIELDGRLNHPVIADKKSFVVLDGMHRVAALERLGCKWIPVCLVDYENPAITVGCWYRAIRGGDALEGIVTQARQASLTVEEVKNIDETKVGDSPIVVAIKNRRKFFLVRSSFQSVKEAYDLIKQIEEGLRKLGLEVLYETEMDALKKLWEHKVDVVLLTPKLSKSSIINTALSGKVFSHKATRHVIPARPLNLKVPLSLLRNGEKTFDEVNDELRLLLQKRRLKHVAAGSILNGRRYEEDLYLFEE